MNIPLPRFSVRTLFASVTVVALAVTALLQATSLWASLTSTLTYLLLCVAVPAIAYRRDAARAFWLGFAVCGWGSMLFGFAHHFDGLPIPELLTSWSVDYAAEQTMPDRDSPYSGYSPVGDFSDPPVIPVQDLCVTPPNIVLPPPPITFNPYSITNARPDPWQERRPAFRRIGREIGTLLLALVGGGLAWSFHATQKNGVEGSCG